MRIMLVAFVISLLSTSAFANEKIDTNAGPGIAMIKVLQSDMASPEAKKYVSAILNGQSYESRISVISSETDAALGTLYVTVTIGEDNMNDDDLGWGAVYKLEVILQRTEEGHDYNVQEVKFEPIAG